MYKEIRHLRKKFFILSALISFVVIFVMLMSLNLLMKASYQNEFKTAEDMVNQIAFSNAPEIDSELIFLKDMQMNDNGDHIVMRNPCTIKSVTLNGEISCSDKNADWYCAGGGLFFELLDNSGNMKFIHKEYKFNQGNTKIIIDFTDNSDFLCEGKPAQTDITKVSDKCFYISTVWWAVSSNMEKENTDNVKLTIDSIEIQYQENTSAASSVNYKALNRNFNEINLTGITQILNNFSCFYIVTDKDNNLVEINNGNLAETISQEYAKDIIQDNNAVLKFGNTKYRHFVTNTDKLKIHAFINNTQAEKNSHLLLLMSVLSGGTVFILVLILIYFVSGKAIKPVSESYEKQKEFISNASHELKMPITVISATTELMEKKNGSDRLLNCIQIQSQKMSRLVNEMLDLTRLSGDDKLTINFQTFDISRTIQNTVLYFESVAFEEKKEILSDIQENLSFKGNQTKIEELVGILLDNAIKYSDEQAQIKISLYSKNDVIILICENPCRNFNKDDIPYLFDRFYRADKSHSGEKEGFGLGLSIAKEIVSLHKGTINTEYKNNVVIFNIKFK
ncbi:sensor histidine kinase [Porcipelethomonas sp.]|uniref:sensor histidine kinase n=1 Tax=Porcipelethomonas sp. TaxID=2981675 RepID=UPI003EF94F95